MGKRIWIMMFAGVLAWLPGCHQAVEPAPEVTPPNGEEGTQETFVAFVMTETTENTRNDVHKEYGDYLAGYEYFNHGTANERAITANRDCNRVLFFADNVYYGASRLDKLAGSDNIYVGRKPISPVEQLPNRFLVVLNGDPARLDLLTETSGVLGKTAEGADAVGVALNYLQRLDTENPESMAMYGEYFTMSSSIFRDEDSRRIAGATEKADFKFYETQEEAVLPENLLKFHVERLAAKVTVRVQEGDVSFGSGEPIILEGASRLKIRKEYSVDSSGEKDVMSSWSANLVNWGINGVEKNTYLFKRLTENPAGAYPWSVESDFYAYGQNKSIWNAPDLYRSYWAVDENYYDGIYPDQYRIALDEDGVDPGSKNTVYGATGSDELAMRDDLTLVYRPYNAFVTRTDHKYSVENTYDEAVLSQQEYNTRPWLRCGSHVIITAQLLVDALDKDVDLTQVDEQGFLKGVSDKFFSNGLYWGEKALMQQAVATLVSNIYMNNADTPIRNVFTGGNVTFIDNDPANPLHDNTPLVVVEAGADGGQTIVPVSYTNATDYFELAPAFIKGGDGWVTIHLKKGVNLRAMHQDGTLSEITEEQLVSYIYRFTNLAKHYNEGRMYYALGIKHNTDSRNFEKGLQQVSTGDYGMVRNHWYRLTVNQALLPGTPVDDPDQPIIPNNEPDDKSLGVEVEIIPWHLVDIHVSELQ